MAALALAFSHDPATAAKALLPLLEASVPVELRHTAPRALLDLGPGALRGIQGELADSPALMRCWLYALVAVHGEDDSSARGKLLRELQDRRDTVAYLTSRAARYALEKAGARESKVLAAWNKRSEIERDRRVRIGPWNFSAVLQAAPLRLRAFSLLSSSDIPKKEWMLIVEQASVPERVGPPLARGLQFGDAVQAYLRHLTEEFARGHGELSGLRAPTLGAWMEGQQRVLSLVMITTGVDALPDEFRD